VWTSSLQLFLHFHKQDLRELVPHFLNVLKLAKIIFLAKLPGHVLILATFGTSAPIIVSSIFTRNSCMLNTVLET
jgi:hypothetical protein